MCLLSANTSQKANYKTIGEFSSDANKKFSGMKKKRKKKQVNQKLYNQRKERNKKRNPIIPKNIYKLQKIVARKKDYGKSFAVIHTRV